MLDEDDRIRRLISVFPNLGGEGDVAALRKASCFQHRPNLFALDCLKIATTTARSRVSLKAIGTETGWRSVALQLPGSGTGLWPSGQVGSKTPTAMWLSSILVSENSAMETSNSRAVSWGESSSLHPAPYALLLHPPPLTTIPS